MKELTQMKQVVIVAIFVSVILVAVFAGFLAGREVGCQQATEETIELDSLRGEIANLHNCLDECTWQLDELSLEIDVLLFELPDSLQRKVLESIWLTKKLLKENEK